jgi:hypothetical protein
MSLAVVLPLILIFVLKYLFPWWLFITLVCRLNNLVALISSNCLRITLNPHEHPYFAQIAHLQVSAHLLIRRRVKWYNLCLFGSVHGMQGLQII